MEGRDPPSPGAVKSPPGGPSGLGDETDVHITEVTPDVGPSQPHGPQMTQRQEVLVKAGGWVEDALPGERQHRSERGQIGIPDKDEVTAGSSRGGAARTEAFQPF